MSELTTIPKSGLVLLIGLFVVLSVKSSAEDVDQTGSPEQQTSEETVSNLIDQLDERYLSDRVKARKKLVDIGKPAVDALITSARNRSHRIRTESLLALGKIGHEKALPVLIEGYLSDEPAIKQAARKAIIQFGVRSFDPLDTYISEHPQSGQKIEGLIRQVVRRQVESVFFDEISDQGGVGYYDGQFRELKTLGRRVIPVLKNMARGEYDFQKHQPKPPSHISRLIRTDYFRHMAINAIGRIGSKKDIAFLKEISADFPSVRFPISRLSSIAMARLGEKGPLEQLKDRVKSKFNEAIKSRDRFQIKNFGGLYSSLLSRTGENKKAIDVYKKLLEFRENDITWYNLACSYAQLGKKKKAINALKRANDLGYRDHGWLKIDGDMDPIRNMDEFQSLLKKMEQNGAETSREDAGFKQPDEEEEKKEEKNEQNETSDDE